MLNRQFPVIDLTATGQNIQRLRRERGLSVRDLKAYFGFEEPQAIYKWQRGKSLPTVDNLYALGALLQVPMEEILVQAQPHVNISQFEQQAKARCSPYFFRLPGMQRRVKAAQALLGSAPIRRWDALPVVLRLIGGTNVKKWRCVLEEAR